MALLIDIEGIDGSGKGTQAAALCKRLEAAGITHCLLSFPRYSQTLFGRIAGEFLNGRFGSLDQVHPLLAAIVFAGDRAESRAMLQAAMDQNAVVVLDRYVASNIAHQAAKRTGEERQELIDRIEEIEHGVFELPRPDLVVLLDLPVPLAQQLIAKKAARDYTQKAADLQEADAVYLQHVRDVYLQQAALYPHWRTLDCTRDGQVRPVEEIEQAVWDLVAPHL